MSFSLHFVRIVLLVLLTSPSCDASRAIAQRGKELQAFNGTASSQARVGLSAVEHYRQAGRAVGQLGLSLAELQEVPDFAREAFMEPMIPREFQTVLCGAISGLIVVIFLITTCQEENVAPASKKDKGQASGSARAALDSPFGNRLHVLDNAKFLLIFLVVYGHILYYSYMGESDDGQTWLAGANQGLKTAFLAVRSFPVPMFCFVSGILTQGPVTVLRLQRFLQFLIVPAFIWIVFAKAFVLGLLTDPSPHTAMSAFNALATFQRFEVRGYEWFLLTLVFWKVTTFLIWGHIRPSFMLALTMLLSASLGYMSLGVFDNMVALLPYFAAGLAFPIEQALSCTKKICPMGSFLVGLLVVLWLMMQDSIFPEPLPDGYGSYSCCFAGTVFEGTKASQGLDYKFYWTRKVTKVTLDILVVKAIILFLVPRWELSLSWVGQHCIYPYLFHGVGLIWRERLVHAFPPPVVTSTYGHALVLLIHVPYAVFLMVLFASTTWRMLFSWCFCPLWFNVFLLHPCELKNEIKAPLAKQDPQVFEACSDSDEDAA